MTIRVAINGFGRIGRLVARAILEGFAADVPGGGIAFLKSRTDRPGPDIQLPLAQQAAPTLHRGSSTPVDSVTS